MTNREAMHTAHTRVFMRDAIASVLEQRGYPRLTDALRRFAGR